ncbi:MAG: 1,4-alpha-glucan branching protein 1,4-alpha-glucan branching enzyme [Candidatus Saccharibacteria bacterium]|nr:1,4-alpha-glucan branching protein 1,4-alpha-glucan branching enzyme [Candidatus Saccharibacteria bacterium]
MHLPFSEQLSEADPWLAPHHDQLQRRMSHAATYATRLLGDSSIQDFALGYLHFGLHTTLDGWVFREWAPAATKIYLIGAFSNWENDEKFALKPKNNGQWEIHLPADALKHGDHYKLRMYWNGGDGYRIPAWATYIVQDSETNVFDAVVWDPETSYEWKDAVFSQTDQTPLIYEAHIGMSSEKEAVSTYVDFTRDVIPRIKAAGYNTIQLMAVAEHPYYGSFGYHVSSFFAPSSRFGMPDELRALVDTAHQAGLRVIMDLVHSHAVKNELDGISQFDGSLDQYFHAGDRGEHAQWDSRVFDYGKPEVAHFLLSNCRYWLDEFHIDGYRFDGVTSMLYTHHGMGKAFSSYDMYFQDIDDDAVAYLTLANQLIHRVKPAALTLAEDMSGMPGLATAINGGIGFDYRLSMGVPDLWIKYVKDIPDEQWHVAELFHELVQHRPEEQTISYAESHDQALVGDKTLIFRLIDKEMYEHMAVGDENIVVDRGIALHKMIRLLTASLHHGGYLNFMGNEFGHPEWIDFPRIENDWSYKYARRQWKLGDNPKLKYHYLAEFDKAMIAIVRSVDGEPGYVLTHDDDHVIGYMRGDLLFVYNFHPTKSFNSYGFSVPTGDYKIILSSDDTEFGGFDRIDTSLAYPASGDDPQLKLYLPVRTCVVLRRVQDAILDI